MFSFIGLFGGGGFGVCIDNHGSVQALTVVTLPILILIPLTSMSHPCSIDLHAYEVVFSWWLLIYLCPENICSIKTEI